MVGRRKPASFPAVLWRLGDPDALRCRGFRRWALCRSEYHGAASDHSARDDPAQYFPGEFAGLPQRRARSRAILHGNPPQSAHVLLMCGCNGFGGGGNPGVNVPGWQKFSVTHTQFQTAGLTQNILLYSLPAGGLIHGVKLKNTIAFAGAGITDYFLSLGFVGALD